MSEKAGLQLEGYTYYAFISYKHEDEKWAVWLQKELQSYRLSSYTRKQHPELPARLSPVFLDKTNLTPGILDDGLKDEVQASKYLIVICSRKAHEQSKYLDDEIGYFLDGGADPSRIIPFIIDESREPEKDCFPARLQEVCRTKSILGANIYENGQRNALLKVIACMHGLKLEELESGDRRRRKRTAVRAAAAVCGAAAILAAGVWRYCDYYLPKTRLYADYSERYGVPEGIGELNRQEADSCGRHYALVFSQGKVRELRYENSYGKICTPEESDDLARPARATYEYGEDGSLHKAVRYDESGVPVLVLDYVNESTVDLTQYQDRDSYAESAFLKAHMTANGARLGSMDDQIYTGEKSSIVRYLIDYTEEGFVREIRYSGNPLHNLAAADAEGIGGIRYERDEKGRAVRLQYLACNGEERSAARAEDYVPAGTRGGIAEVRYQYDDRDNLTETAYIGEEGKPVRNSWDVALESLEYDDFHNVILSCYYDEDGSPADSADGCAMIEWTRDSHGNVTEETYLDTGKEKTEIIYGYACARREFDENGNLLKEAYYDEDGSPKTDMTGIAAQTCAYDSEGRRTEIWKYGAGGELVLNDYGIAGLKTEYDEQGNVVKIEYFGTDREPVLCRDHAAVLTEEYDEAGNPVLTSCLGTDGKPVTCVHGYAQMAREYDSRGNLSRIRYLDENGKPTLNNEGLSIVEKDCDERGKITAFRYYGTEGEPVASHEGVASIEMAYDEYGNMTKSSCYGTDGEPAVNIFGYASMEMEYDSRSNMTEHRMYGPDGSLSENAYGWAVWRCTYDDFGRPVADYYFAADGTFLGGTGNVDPALANQS